MGKGYGVESNAEGLNNNPLVAFAEENSNEPMILISQVDFQKKILDCITSEEIDKYFYSAQFNNDSQCRQAMIYGMTIASLLANQCKPKIVIKGEKDLPIKYEFKNGESIKVVNEEDCQETKDKQVTNCEDLQQYTDAKTVCEEIGYLMQEIDSRLWNTWNTQQLGEREFRGKTFDELCDIGQAMFEKLRVMSRYC